MADGRELFDDLPTLIDPHAGVDEVGRGPLAGPVVAAAVMLNPNDRIDGLRDSKLLTAEVRETLAEQIHARALAVGIGRAEVHEVDELNILYASFRAMQRAVMDVMGRGSAPRVIYVDGHLAPEFAVHAVPVIGGDGIIEAISAASIVAKVVRDREMIALSRLFPGYGFEQHKGYATPAHRAALRKLGPSPLHRRSFAPVRALLEGDDRLSDGAPAITSPSRGIDLT